MTHKLAGLTALFCCGIYFASCLRVAFFQVYLLSIAILILSYFCLRRAFLSEIMLSSLVFLAGAASLENTQQLPSNHIYRIASSKTNAPYLVRGFICADPSYKNGRTSFIFEVKALQFGSLNRDCSGRILVFIRGGRDFSYQEELTLRGFLRRPFSKNGRMRGNYANYLFNQGIYFTLYIKNDLDIVRLNKNKVWTINKFPVFLKKKIEARIRRNLSGLSAYVVEAMILGEKDNLPASLYNLMVKCGTVHILVVSGFNVGIVAFIVLLFLKVIRLRRKIRIFITIICLVVYCLATGASNPVVRATIMAVVFLLAYLFKRQPDIYISLAIAAIFILGICPRQLFDVGFQLSFASVFFIAYLYPKFSRLLRIDSCRIKFIRFFVDGFLVSFSAWLGTMGIIASNFRSFSPITTLANIFVVPLATLITLSGFSLLFTGWLFPQLATFIARTLELWVWLLLGIHNMLVKLPFSYLSF